MSQLTLANTDDLLGWSGDDWMNLPVGSCFFQAGKRFRIEMSNWTFQFPELTDRDEDPDGPASPDPTGRRRAQ